VFRFAVVRIALAAAVLMFAACGEGSSTQTATVTVATPSATAASAGRSTPEPGTSTAQEDVPCSKVLMGDVLADSILAITERQVPGDVGREVNRRLARYCRRHATASFRSALTEVLPALVDPKKCGDLVVTADSWREPALESVRSDLDLDGYTDEALVEACSKHPSVPVATEARALAKAAQERADRAEAAKAAKQAAARTAKAAKQAANRARYSPVDRDSFVAACVGTGGTVTRCACLFRQFTLHVSYDQFVRDNEAILDGRLSSDELLSRYADLIDRCSGF
jgi:hypothetical protein